MVFRQECFPVNLKNRKLTTSLRKKLQWGYPVSIKYEFLPYSQTLDEVIGAMTK